MWHLSIRALAITTALLVSSFWCLSQNNETSKTAWISQLARNGLNINDSTIYYPKVPRIAINVAKWVGSVFNSYDTAYVVSAGKNWKIYANSSNWLVASELSAPKHMPISMHTELYSDVGAYLSILGIAVGQKFNVNDWLGHPTKRKTFNFDFTCTRFALNIAKQTSHGGMIITQFGDYKPADGHRLRYHFNDISINSLSGDMLYFFNHRRYSHAAAYSFDKYQIKSGGSWMAGFSFSKQSSSMDFASLPEPMKECSPIGRDEYSFRYNDYTAIGGYAYNWAAVPRKWLVNSIGLLAAGYKHGYEDATDGRRNMVANNIKLRFALVYNHRALFASLQTRFDGYLYYNSNLAYFNSFTTLTAVIGARF